MPAAPAAVVIAVVLERADFARRELAVASTCRVRRDNASHKQQELCLEGQRSWTTGALAPAVVYRGPAN